MSTAPSMHDYILRQPEILSSVYDRKESWLTILQSMLETHPMEEIVFLGSGTSHHVSTAAAALAERHLPIQARAVLPAQFIGSRILHPSRTLAVGISQSGNSLSTLNAIRYAKEQGCPVLAFSLEEDSALVRECDAWMPLVCERELVPPETQGYTAAILEWILAIRQAAGLDTDVTKELSALPKVVAESEAFVRAHLHDILRAPKITVTGSGLHWATAMEGALKMRETLRHAVMREEIEELSHLADLAFEDDDLLMAIVQTDRDRQTVNLVRQITDHVLEIEAGEDDFSLITAVIPFQLAGAIGAAGLGNDTSKYPYEIENISHGEGFLFR